MILFAFLTLAFHIFYQGYTPYAIGGCEMLYNKDRCEVLAQYVIETGATVRACAGHFGISKSTVHKDLTSKLKYINKNLYKEVRKILCLNKSERHLRGGEATRRKYLYKRAGQSDSSLL